jgi:hypothetical protein
MPGLSAEAIKIFERGWCSHVDAIMPDGSLLGARSDVVGGQPPGVQVRPANYEVWDRLQIVSLQSSRFNESAFLDFLRAQIGKPYDHLAILAFSAHRDWHNADSWFCSELQAAALEVCGWFPRKLAEASNEITPRDLLLVISPWVEN